MGDDDRIVDDSDDNLGSDQEPESDNDNDQKDNQAGTQDRSPT
jgi:hypothetical protein